MNDMSPIRDLVQSAYETTSYVYLDIETIPTQSPEVIAAIKAGVKPPATLKKAESIEAWHKESGQAAGVEAVAKTSFDGGRGHVCTIAWASGTGEVKHAHAESVSDEASVIRALFDDLPKYKSVVFVGHNVAGFDLPFLLKRAVCLGIVVPHCIPRDVKPWGDRINDTMLMWTGSARDYISMDALCGILGIPGKGGMDGSQVAGAWADGRHEEIATYCAADVERTRTIHQRFLSVGW